MRLLLTGATGFVGRNLLLRAIRSGQYKEIFVAVRTREKLRAQLLGDGFDEIPKMVVAVPCRASDWDFQRLGPMDHLIHSAGSIQADTRRDYFDVNTEGTIRLFSKLPRASKIIVLSSQAAAGPNAAGCDYRTEADRETPITWYGESKLEMEKRLAHEFPHYPYVCLRPSLLFGPRDQMTLPLFKMAKGMIHFKPGIRPKYYSYLSVDDLIEAIFSAFQDTSDWSTLRARIYFVASQEPISDIDMLVTAAEACGSKGIRLPIPHPFIFAASRVVDSVPTLRRLIPMLSRDRSRDIFPERWVVSPKAFSERFGWSPKKNLKITFKETRDWYVATGQLGN